MKKKLNLKSIRDKIDKIDDKILPLVIKRSKLVSLALEAKKFGRNILQLRL